MNPKKLEPQFKFKVTHGFMKNGFSVAITGAKFIYFYGVSYQFQICFVFYRVTFSYEKLGL